MRPHGWQPTRLPHPWDSPGKNAGVGCHLLLQRIFPTQGSKLGLINCKQTLYPLSHQGSQRWRSSIQSAKTRPGADCGSDHELIIAKFRLKLKKVGKTTRPFTYDLNQIPYDYPVEVKNRFKRLDLIGCLMTNGWRFMTLSMRQGSRPFPWKRNAKKQNDCLGRPYK